MKNVDELLCSPDAEIITALRATSCPHFCRYFHMNYRYLSMTERFLARRTTGNDIPDFVFFLFFFEIPLLLQIVCGHQAVMQLHFFRITITRNPDSPDSIVVSSSLLPHALYAFSFLVFFFLIGIVHAWHIRHVSPSGLNTSSLAHANASGYS